MYQKLQQQATQHQAPQHRAPQQQAPQQNPVVMTAVVSLMVTMLRVIAGQCSVTVWEGRGPSNIARQGQSSMMSWDTALTLRILKDAEIFIHNCSLEKKF